MFIARVGGSATTAAVAAASRVLHAFAALVLVLSGILVVVVVVRRTDVTCRAPQDADGLELSGAASAAQEELRDSSLLYLFHMPKTGGTTLSKAIAQAYCSCPSGVLEHATFAASAARCTCPFADVHEASSRCSMRLEHCSFGASARHCHDIASPHGRTCRYVTALRDPVERTISQWRLCASTCSRSLNARTCNHLGLPCPEPGPGNASLAHFARHAWNANAQTRLLSGDWSAAECGAASYHQPADSELSLARATARLEAMWLVGTTERLDGLQACLRARLGPGRAETAAHRALGEACTHVDGTGRRLECRSSASVVVEPWVRALIRENNRLDAELHAAAERIYDDRCGAAALEPYNLSTIRAR